MICSCRNMTLSTMIVLKLHKISLYFFSGLISTITLPVLFSSLFLPQMKVFFTLHSFTFLSHFVCQAICFTFLFIFLSIFFFSVATIYFPVLFFFDFPCFLPHLILVFYCVPFFTVILFADDTYPSYIHIHQCYI